MANKVETLFRDVMALLPELDNFPDTPDWPDCPWDEFDSDRVGPFYGALENSILVPWNAAFPESSTSRMSTEQRRSIAGALRIWGSDILGFYKSRRFIKKQPFPGMWGIFYLQYGIEFLALEIEQAYPGYGNPVVLARDFLYAHEHFHFRADLQTLMLESVLKHHLYIPLHNALRGRRTYFVEEALANREAWNWSKSKPDQIREFARDFMEIQPNAYGRYNERLSTLTGEWSANTIDLQPPYCPPRNDFAPWVMATPKDLLRESLCPQYLVQVPNATAWINPAWMPPPVTEVIDGARVIRLLDTRYASLREKWDATKRKLIEDRLRAGLNFKPWNRDGFGAYSIRVDDSFRAHLRNLGNGTWEAYELGPHTKMGHG